MNNVLNELYHYVVILRLFTTFQMSRGIAIQKGNNSADNKYVRIGPP